VSGDRDLSAGDFSSWMVEIRAAITERRESDVPCNGCTACCRSSQFVNIGPDEVETLARVPAELLFPAPGRPPGHVVLGYDERGHCPMLVDDKCSIYRHRPNACRTYDCRVFPAAGLDPGTDKVEIMQRSRCWQFEYAGEDDRVEHDAVRAAASFLSMHPELLRDAGLPSNETQVAAFAIEIHDVFLHRDERSGQLTVVRPETSVVRAALPPRQ
jgi:Fe-S-cluster containining protein